MGLLCLRAREPGPGKLCVIEAAYWFDGHTPYHLVEFVTKDDKSDCLFDVYANSILVLPGYFKIES